MVEIRPFLSEQTQKEVFQRMPSGYHLGHLELLLCSYFTEYERMRAVHSYIFFPSFFFSF